MIEFKHSKADLYIPDSLEGDDAIARTTHLGIGAHQDDLEFMALHGILECFQRADQWFGGVTCTDGAGSSRTAEYEDYTDEEMKAVRLQEQKTAALIGQYSFMAQLAHPTSVAKLPEQRGDMVADLEAVLRAAQPQVVYVHNPFDKHPTHVGVLLAALSAIRSLPESERPHQLIGCEVWRGLDWLPESEKMVLPLDGHPNLAAALNGVFDSQIVGGKRYDLAVEGRRVANATFLDAHSVDQVQRAAYAIDLTPLIQGEALRLADYTQSILTGFTEGVNSIADQLEGE